MRLSAVVCFWFLLISLRSVTGIGNCPTGYFRHLTNPKCSEECCYCGPDTSPEPQCKGNPNGKECQPLSGSKCIETELVVEPTTSEEDISDITTALKPSFSPTFKSALTSSVIHSVSLNKPTDHRQEPTNQPRNSKKQPIPSSELKPTKPIASTISIQPVRPPDLESTTVRASSAKHSEIESTVNQPLITNIHNNYIKEIIPDYAAVIIFLITVALLLLLLLVCVLCYKKSKTACNRVRYKIIERNEICELLSREEIKNGNLTVKDTLGNPTARPNIDIPKETLLKIIMAVFDEETTIKLTQESGQYRAGMKERDRNYSLGIHSPKTFEDLMGTIKRLLPNFTLYDFLCRIQGVHGIESISSYIKYKVLYDMRIKMK